MIAAALSQGAAIGLQGQGIAPAFLRPENCRGWAHYDAHPCGHWSLV